MCEFCTQHGEGKKWYLQAKNYSEELLNEERKRRIRDVVEKFDHGPALDGYGALDKLVATDPVAARAAFPSIAEQLKKEGWGQVVPPEDAEQILDMSLSVVRLPCACRSVLRGFRDARYCFGVTRSHSEFQLEAVQPHPDISSDLEVLSRDEAKKVVQKFDRNGLVHTVWGQAPFIGMMCNCTVSDCLPLKVRTRIGMPRFFKGEYVSSIDWQNCNGCRDCMKLCSFGAISYSAYANKCSINQLQCYGCGVCRALCARDAIALRDRNAIPALANEW